MSSYNRPSVVAPVFHDADGQIIDYGNRWSGSPPEETYSVDTHPERFAPLHTVADALIAHLRATYDVRLTEGEGTAGDLLRPAPEFLRAVRIQPNDPACAALTFVFTAYPGIFLHAGLLHDFHYPVCGCDACDSNWTTEADLLEQQVLAVVTGHYREGIEDGPQPWVEYAFTYPDGANSGRSRAEEIPAERFEAAKPILCDLTEGWASWPQRSSGS
ncbi:hypothetical protein FHE66_09360 [Georgenia sp. 311]|uniref:DUF6226 family protein n=1 Tax=Georgenia sp. 311 TaxID=2585134 RepID=UPI0011129C5F|nr:DUF6226 family protein [Georgenia sp. 311]TNC17640.1 hypothetical protein FHE66_09360 [Georgenia sp. 311]